MAIRTLLRLIVVVVFFYLPQNAQSQSLSTYLSNKKFIDSLIIVHAELDSVSYLQMVKYTYPCKKIKKDVAMMLLIDDFINRIIKQNNIKKRFKNRNIYFQERTNEYTRYKIYGGYLMAVIYDYKEYVSIDVICYKECDSELFGIHDYYNFEYLLRYAIPYIKYPIYLGEKGFFSFNMYK